MATRYIDELDAWIKARGVKKPGANIAAFLAIRDFVKVRLEEGYSATTIHAFLVENKRIDVCYDTFLKYVHRHVQQPRKGAKARIHRAQARFAALNAAKAETVKQDRTVDRPAFKFNPVPNRDDLF